jgi:hypothetical protein
VNNTIYPTNPVGEVDPLGLDACYVHFPNYPITYNETGDTSTRLGGHAGVLTYDKKGSTKYYEYGRYSTGIGAKLPEDDGNIRRVYIPNLKINKDGNPTAESMAALKAALSRNAGKNTEATLTCSASSDLSKVHEHIKKIANDPNRDKYSWNPFSPNHCRSFAKDAVEAGRGK